MLFVARLEKKSVTKQSPVLHVRSWNGSQLVTILEARLAEANSSMGKVFDNSAVTMAAAKVAAASGDMRTCLKYCCRAVEVCV